MSSTFPLCLILLSGLMYAATPDEALWRQCVFEAGIQNDNGHFDQAARLMEKAVHHAEHFPESDSRLAATLHDLAYFYQQLGRTPEAIAVYLRAIRAWEKLGSEHHDGLSRSIDNLISAYADARDYRAAEKLVVRRLPEFGQSGATWLERATLLNLRGFLAYAHRNYREAELFFSESLSLFELHRPAEDRHAAIVMSNLAQVHVATRQYGKALELEVRSLAILETLGPSAEGLLVRELDHAAFSCVKLKRTEDAEQYYRSALDIARRVFGPDHRAVAQIMMSYSSVLSSLRRNAEARAMAHDAGDILGRANPATSVDVLALMTRR